MLSITLKEYNLWISEQWTYFWTSMFQSLKRFHVYSHGFTLNLSDLVGNFKMFLESKKAFRMQPVCNQRWVCRENCVSVLKAKKKKNWSKAYRQSLMGTDLRNMCCEPGQSSVKYVLEQLGNPCNRIKSWTSLSKFQLYLNLNKICFYFIFYI